ncbi:hypothetical protein EJB05_55972 [Eragrostis curvula]|uniref:DUF6598 domain-containing protein n=1 Tax=Eragrostis curvula TaxID=38414 RepID=A0A5J9SHI0_9POAL|nr:hypothetical protein EJB05_55972 [Eragrostis curvula]
MASSLTRGRVWKAMGPSYHRPPNLVEPQAPPLLPGFLADCSAPTKRPHRRPLSRCGPSKYPVSVPSPLFGRHPGLFLLLAKVRLLIPSARIFLHPEVMDLIEAREQKRQRTVSYTQGSSDTGKDMLDADEGGKQFKDENLGETEDLLGTVEIVTDDENYDDEDIEGAACEYRVTDMTRQPGHKDEIDWAANNIDKCSVPCTSLFTYFEEGEWSQTGVLVQLISVKVIEGAGKYLFGKILSLNYRNKVLSFYNRDSNDCEMLDGKAVASLCSPHRVLQIVDELDIYVDLSTKDSELSEEKEVGRGIITWQGLQMRPGIFSDLVCGMHGLTKVTYAVISEGVEAVVGIDIIGRSTKNLRTKIVAINEMFGKIVLFDGILGNALLDEESIPLRNPVLAVSKEEGQKLEIRVSLGEDNTGKVNQRATFYPKFSSCDMTSDKVSRYGTLRMKVEWSAVPYPNDI